MPEQPKVLYRAKVIDCTRDKFGQIIEVIAEDKLWPSEEAVAIYLAPSEVSHTAACGRTVAWIPLTALEKIEETGLTENVCKCDIRTLMISGCKCGALAAERAKL